MSDATRPRLRFVKSDAAADDLRYFPDFMIVGPQRTGTTWLHAHLRWHPQILLAEPKEIFFFDRLGRSDDARFASDDLGWYLRHFREPLWRTGLRHAACLWRHRELFRPRVRGEATASYAAMSGERIDEVVALNPELRAILMVRDPVERAWSHAKKDLARKTGRAVGEIADREWHAFFRDCYQVRCAGIVSMVDAWSKRLQPGHLWIGAFEEIARRPRELLLEVMSFLGVCSDARYVPGDVHEEVNPTAKSSVPQRHREYLEELLGEQIAALETRLGSAERRAERLARMRRPPEFSVAAPQ